MKEFMPIVMYSSVVCLAIIFIAYCKGPQEVLKWLVMAYLKCWKAFFSIEGGIVTFVSGILASYVFYLTENLDVHPLDAFHANNHHKTMVLTLIFSGFAVILFNSPLWKKFMKICLSDDRDHDPTYPGP